MASNPLPKPAAAPVLPLSGGLSLDTELYRSEAQPFPVVADIVGRPIRPMPHRLAKTVRDDESYNRLRAGHRDYARIEQLIAQDMRRQSRLPASLLWLSPAIIAVAYFGWQFAR